ncbi:wall-associated receptor kinase-like 8 isoform X2 [Hevea brasiliensis]|uniref:wall-associated receptor kinase-like 8 isoform X2 n=1 Tax=Hevea brasiliensis TaxID=3981 RepID=UPI0025EE54C8|nr:wall-associated receptor kinase-like 8 isoform X2 [Hevea brasiliensis]
MNVKLVYGVSLSLALMLTIQLAIAKAPIAKPNCTDHCGNINIPYPFGMGKGCYLGDWFEIECHNSVDRPPRAFISKIKTELLNISVRGRANVKSPIISSNCSDKETDLPVNLTGSPFFISPDNIFTAIGCNTRALMTDNPLQRLGCDSTCLGGQKDVDWREMLPNLMKEASPRNYRIVNNCNGTDCCQITIPSSLQVLNPSLQAIDGNQSADGCKVAFLAGTYESYSRREKDSNVQFPMLLDWMVNSTLREDYFRMVIPETLDCDYSSSNELIFRCSCNSGYEGNPYLRCIGICPGVVVMFVLKLCARWLCESIQKRKKINQREKFFKRMSHQQIWSSQGKVEKAKIFSLKELKKATDHFNVNRIVGQGGQGTVYKGMLVDGKIIAVKKSKIVDEAKLEEFINEVVILSQINHRNVVKLFGCCLETEVPMLVYEFISNGTLFQHLHDQGEDFPLLWSKRLQIAIEISGALSYLHSAAPMPIFHRDIKSTNILLDEKYRAKLSDFGISRSVAIGQTHLTTNVHGTFGYLDPEYFHSSQFTEKSDVYSFGVVLVELLTGREPICSTKSEEVISLATSFIQMMQNNKLFDIIDPRIKEQFFIKEEIMVVANLAKRCLNPNGKERPTMRRVTMELEAIWFSNGDVCVEEHKEENELDLLDISAASTSTCSNFAANGTLSIDIKPLVLGSTW